MILLINFNQVGNWNRVFQAVQLEELKQRQYESGTYIVEYPGYRPGLLTPIKRNRRNNTLTIGTTTVKILHSF